MRSHLSAFMVSSDKEDIARVVQFQTVDYDQYFDAPTASVYEISQKEDLVLAARNAHQFDQPSEIEELAMEISYHIDRSLDLIYVGILGYHFGTLLHYLFEILERHSLFPFK